MVAQARCDKTFFSADGDDRFGVGVNIHLIAPLVPGGDRQTQFVDAARNRIAVVGGLAGGFDELRHHMGRRRQIGIAHAEVDDVFTPVPRLHLHAVDDAEDIGRQPFDPLKFHAWLPYPF